MSTVDPSLHRHHHHGWWWKSLLIGLGLWGATVGTTVVTLNANLIPMLVLIGSFVVPFAVVMFAAERLESTSVTSLLAIFFISGVFGILGASLLESVLTQSPVLYLVVGLIEELVKGVIVLVVGWRMSQKSVRQGALIGATVGAGFAAFESSGYALITSLTSQGISVVQLLQTELVRALLTPVAHVLWTGILGAVIFAAFRMRSRTRAVLATVGTYLGVSVLHGLWDSMSGIAAAIASAVSGASSEYAQFGFVGPSVAHIANELDLAFYWTGLVILAAIGWLTLGLLVRRHRPQDARAQLAAASA